MYVDLPQIKRCCCCLPLRYGLLAWGYFKLLSTLLCLLLGANSLAKSSHAIDITVLSIALIITITDICFDIVFIVGAHLKRHRLLRVYYYYSIVTISLYAALLLFGIGLLLYHLMYYYIGFYLIFNAALLCVGVLALVLQFYIILLLRSEIFKLKSEMPFKFVNVTIGADADDQKSAQEKVIYGRMSDDNLEDKLVV